MDSGQTLLLDSPNTFSMDAFVTLDDAIKDECRCGWKGLTKDIHFSLVMVPQKMLPPNSQKRDKPERYSFEELKIAEKLSCRKIILHQTSYLRKASMLLLYL